jgi:hypothetical protein
MKTLLVAILLFVLAACAGMENPEQLPRGFTQPGSPFPFNSTGW